MNVLLIFFIHIDEINNNQSAHVSSAAAVQLLLLLLSLPAESTLLAFCPFVSTGIYIDRNEGFGFIKDEIGARLKPFTSIAIRSVSRYQNSQKSVHLLRRAGSVPRAS